MLIAAWSVSLVEKPVSPTSTTIGLTTMSAVAAPAVRADCGAQRRRDYLCKERAHPLPERDSYRRITAARNSPNAVQVTANWIQLIVK
jgi:hypothetical protein